MQERESLELDLIQESTHRPVAQPEQRHQLKLLALGRQEAWEVQAFPA